MKKPVVATRKNALVMLEQCPPEKFKAWIIGRLTASQAVMIGATRSGKALVVTTFTDEGREKDYPEELEELYDALDVSDLQDDLKF